MDTAFRKLLDCVPGEAISGMTDLAASHHKLLISVVYLRTKHVFNIFLRSTTAVFGLSCHIIVFSDILIIFTSENNVFLPSFRHWLLLSFDVKYSSVSCYFVLFWFCGDNLWFM